MPISLEKARHFVYAHGVLGEQALFRRLFGGAPVERLHRS